MAFWLQHVFSRFGNQALSASREKSHILIALVVLLTNVLSCSTWEKRLPAELARLAKLSDQLRLYSHTLLAKKANSLDHTPLSRLTRRSLSPNPQVIYSSAALHSSAHYLPLLGENKSCARKYWKKVNWIRVWKSREGNLAADPRFFAKLFSLLIPPPDPTVGNVLSCSLGQSTVRSLRNIEPNRSVRSPDRT